MSEQKKAFLAVILSGIVLFAWQAYFVNPQQQPVKKSEEKNPAPPIPPSIKNTEKKLEKIPVVQISLNNREGHAALLANDFSLTEIFNPNQSQTFEEIVGKDPFKIQIIENGQASDLAFEIKKSADGKSFSGIDSRRNISLKGHLDNLGRIHFSLMAKKPHAYRLLYRMQPQQLENGRIRQYLIYGKKEDRFEVGDKNLNDGLVNFVAVDHNHHLFALVFQEKKLLRYRAFESGKMLVDLVKPSSNFSGLFVYSKKNYDHLMELGDNLELSVDFGLFAILAIPILRGLQFFYKYFPNYGVAIILLTLIIRLLTFPLQLKSFKSMKKMQVIQPELQKLKKKYADDPQRMQKETLALFKKAGANPLGGCFPILLQMPIFFAFYQVLYNAVELVGAPFCFWITDLSEKDAFYVLPVLMGAAMFGQTKLTPTTTADSTQQKIMLFMPIIFAFIMKDFPSGLNLYILVSTLFGIIQQLIVYKAID